MAVTLRELLDAATPWPWQATSRAHPLWGEVPIVLGNDPDDDGDRTILHENAGRHPADARLIALAPELAALVLDMADALRADEETMSAVDWLAWHKTREALLARLDRISTQTQGEEKGQDMSALGEKEAIEPVVNRAACYPPVTPPSSSCACVCDPGDCGEDCGTA